MHACLLSGHGAGTVDQYFLPKKLINQVHTTEHAHAGRCAIGACAQADLHSGARPGRQGWRSGGSPPEQHKSRAAAPHPIQYIWVKNFVC